LDKKEYGDELFIYVMTLMEQIEEQNKKAQNEELQEGDEE